MVENLLYRASRSLTQTVNEAVPSWKANDINPSIAHEMEEALPLIQEWPTHLRRLLDSLWRKAVRGEIDSFQASGESFQRLAAEQIQVVHEIKELAIRYKQLGQVVPDPEQYQAIHSQLSQIKEAFAENWPWVDERILAEAREEYTREECQSLEEIIDELQGKHS